MNGKASVGRSVCASGEEGQVRYDAYTVDTDFFLHSLSAITHKDNTMKSLRTILSMLALCVAPGTSEYDVPTKKAIPPKMDPVP